MAKYIAMGVAAIFATAEALELSPDNFEAEVKGSKNAFVKFWAPWCVHRTPPRSGRYGGSVAGRLSHPLITLPHPQRPHSSSLAGACPQVRPLQTHEARLGPAGG